MSHCCHIRINIMLGIDAATSILSLCSFPNQAYRLYFRLQDEKMELQRPQRLDYAYRPITKAGQLSKALTLLFHQPSCI